MNMCESSGEAWRRDSMAKRFRLWLLGALTLVKPNFLKDKDQIDTRLVSQADRRKTDEQNKTKTTKKIPNVENFSINEFQNTKRDELLLNSSH